VREDHALAGQAREADVGERGEGLAAPTHALDRSESGLEAEAVAGELRQLAVHPEPATRPAPVALVFDYEALWALDTQPQGANYNGLQLAFECYSALRSLALDVDIVPASADLSTYRLVVLPAMPLVTPVLQAQLGACKAQVVLYPRTGSKLACFQIPPNLPPGELQRLIDLKVTRVESLRPGVLEEVHMDDKRYVASRWREALRLGAGVKAEACFADGTPAVARQGRTRYLAGWFSAELQREVLERAARDAALGTTRLPDAVRVRRRGDWLMAFNYGDTAHELGVPQATWLLGSAVLAPHGVAIARRR
jgi:beta-galactosidase